MRNFLRSRRGFTLLELIVVIVILAVLAALAIPTFTAVINRSHDERSLAELHAATREAVAVVALSQEGSREVSAKAWLSSGAPTSAYGSGVYAAQSLRSIAYKGNAAPEALPPEALLEALGAVSDEYGFFSVDLPEGSPLGLAMRSSYSPHCVFAAYDASSGALKGSAVASWRSEGSTACKGENAVKVIEDNTPDPGDDSGTVTPPEDHEECVSVIPASWYPLEVQPAEDSSCAPGSGFEVGSPDPAPAPSINPGYNADPNLPVRLPITSGDFASAAVRNLTSFPHSNPGYSHYVFGASSNGGVFWVKDSGVKGVDSKGCAVPGAQKFAPCESSWLFPPGTFWNPSVLITGQGPGHGTIPADFSFDTMFIADGASIFTAGVDSFTSASDPSLLVDFGSDYYAVEGMTGFACFDTSGAKVSGNCLWAVLAGNSGTRSLAMVNVETGNVERMMDLALVPGMPIVALNSITYDGVPQLLLSYEGAFQRVRVDGTLAGGLAVVENWGNVTTLAEGQLVLSRPDAGSIEKSTSLPVALDSDVPQVVNGFSIARMVPTTHYAAIGDFEVSALHSHGVPDQLYAVTTNGCLTKYNGSTLYTLTCFGAAPFELLQSRGNSVAHSNPPQGDLTAYYLVQHSRVPGAVGYRLESTGPFWDSDLGEWVTRKYDGYASASEPLEDRGYTWDDSPQVSRPGVGTFSYGVRVKTHPGATNIADFYLDGLDVRGYEEPPNVDRRNFEFSLRVRGPWSGRATLTNPVSGEEVPVLFTTTDSGVNSFWTCSSVCTNAIFTEKNEAGYYQFRLTLEGTGSYPSFGSYSSGTHARHGLVEFDYDTIFTGPDPDFSDPIHIWTRTDGDYKLEVVEYAVMADGSEVEVGTWVYQGAPANE